MKRILVASALLLFLLSIVGNAQTFHSDGRAEDGATVPADYTGRVSLAGSATIGGTVYTRGNAVEVQNGQVISGTGLRTNQAFSVGDAMLKSDDAFDMDNGVLIRGTFTVQPGSGRSVIKVRPMDRLHTVSSGGTTSRLVKSTAPPVEIIAHEGATITLTESDPAQPTVIESFSGPVTIGQSTFTQGDNVDIRDGVIWSADNVKADGVVEVNGQQFTSTAAMSIREGKVYDGWLTLVGQGESTIETSTRSVPITLDGSQTLLVLKHGDIREFSGTVREFSTLGDKEVAVKGNVEYRGGSGTEQVVFGDGAAALVNDVEIPLQGVNGHLGKSGVVVDSVTTESNINGMTFTSIDTENTQFVVTTLGQSPWVTIDTLRDTEISLNDYTGFVTKTGINTLRIPQRNLDIELGGFGVEEGGNVYFPGTLTEQIIVNEIPLQLENPQLMYLTSGDTSGLPEDASYFDTQRQDGEYSSIQLRNNDKDNEVRFRIPKRSGAATDTRFIMASEGEVSITYPANDEDNMKMDVKASVFEIQVGKVHVDEPNIRIRDDNFFIPTAEAGASLEFDIDYTVTTQGNTYTGEIFNDNGLIGWMKSLGDTEAPAITQPQVSFAPAQPSGSAGGNSDCPPGDRSAQCTENLLKQMEDPDYHLNSLRNRAGGNCAIREIGEMLGCRTDQ